MIDIEFRKGLYEAQKDNPCNDAAVIRFVLDHAWDQYPRPFFVWLNRNMRDYDQFGDKNTADPMPVRLFRCDACHAVQAFEVRDGAPYPKTCACGSRFGWTQIKVVD